MLFNYEDWIIIIIINSPIIHCITLIRVINIREDYLEESILDYDILFAYFVILKLIKTIKFTSWRNIFIDGGIS